MKRIVFVFSAVVALLAAASCDNKENGGTKLSDVTLQLSLNGSNMVVQDVKIAVTDGEGATTYEEVTDDSGAAMFKLPAGSYTAMTSFKIKDDELATIEKFSGSLSFIVSGDEEYKGILPLTQVNSSQIIIKELYSTSCLGPDGTKTYSNDAYITLYNNSDTEADASNLAIAFCAPYNSNSVKYVTDGKLLYEDLGWLPTYGAIWYFKNPVKIDPYSSITIAVFGAIDHTKTVPNSVNLSNPAYYYMSNEGLTAYTNAKYQVAEGMDSGHALTASVITPGNAWALSVTSPALFIASMPQAQVKALVADTDAYDTTMGTSNAMKTVKFPVANVLDAIEGWDGEKMDQNGYRLPSCVNAGSVVIISKKGHTFYRNVDKEATEALPENAGKIVYGYAGGTLDAETGTGSTDPSGIDAEASIKAGCHIIYSDTNNSSVDFHERAVSALK